MNWRFMRAATCCSFALVMSGWAQKTGSGASLIGLKAPNVEITKAVATPAGTTEEKPWGQGRTTPLPERRARSRI